MAGYGPVDSVHDQSSLKPGGESDAPDGDPTSHRAGSDGGPEVRFRWRKRHTLVSILAVILVAAIVSWVIQLP